MNFIFTIHICESQCLKPKPFWVSASVNLHSKYQFTNVYLWPPTTQRPCSSINHTNMVPIQGPDLFIYLYESGNHLRLLWQAQALQLAVKYLQVQKNTSTSSNTHVWKLHQCCICLWYLELYNFKLNAAILYIQSKTDLSWLQKHTTVLILKKTTTTTQSPHGNFHYNLHNTHTHCIDTLTAIFTSCAISVFLTAAEHHFLLWKLQNITLSFNQKIN